MNLSEGYKKRLSDLAGLKLESASSFPITKEWYDFLLPIYGQASSDNGFSHSNKLLAKHDPRRKIDTYYFIGTEEEYREALQRGAYRK